MDPSCERRQVYIVMDVMKICLFDLMNVEVQDEGEHPTARRRKFSDDEASNLFEGCAKGLEYLHEYVHPTNFQFFPAD